MNVTLQTSDNPVPATTPLDGHGLEYWAMPTTPTEPIDLVLKPQPNALPTGDVLVNYRCDAHEGDAPYEYEMLFQAMLLMTSAGKAMARGERADLKAALDLYTQATSLLATNPPSVHSGHARYFRARLLQDLNQPMEALVQYEAAARQFTQAESDEDSGDVFATWSLSLIDLGRFEEARAVLDEALTHLGEDAPPQLLGSIYSNRGLSLHYQGQLDEALRWYRSAEQQFRVANDHTGLAQVTNNMGGIFFDRNQADEAMAYFDQARRAHEATGNKVEIATTLGNTGLLQTRMGDFGGALKSYLRARRMIDSMGNTREMGRANHRLGWMYARMGNYERAQTYLSRALELRTQSQDLVGQADTLSALGRMYSIQAQPLLAASAAAMALWSFEEAEESGRVATQQTHLALSLIDLPELPFSLTTVEQLLQQAARTAKELEQRRIQADIVYAQGRLALTRNNWEKALLRFDAAAKLARREANPVLAASSLLALAQTQYRNGNAAFALETTEQTIALVESIRSRIASPTLRSQYLATQRAAFELLVNLHAQRDDAWGALAAAERFRSRRLVESLRWSDPGMANNPPDSKLNAYLATSTQLNTIAARTGQFSRRGKSQNPAWEAQYLDLASQLDALEADLALTDQPQQLSLQQAAKQLRPGEVFYELFLGETQSWAWTITPHDIRMVTLPARGELESLTESVLQALAVPSASPNRAAARALSQLSQILLTPLEQSDQATVLFAPDGFVSLVPLTALRWPGSQDYFYAKASVVLAPSLAAIARQRAKANTAKSETGRRALLVGSPTIRHMTLEGGRQEVEALSKLLGDNANVLIGEEAHRPALINKPLSSYGLLHFATHAGASSRDHLASGLYLRSTAADASPALISEKDLFTWQLNADLVTLSGCETLRGRYLEGEGLQSMARALMYAGARSVLASLWRVDDTATRFLMLAFYESYLTNQDAAAALAEAQQKTAAQPRWRDPYYWAGFQLHASQ